MPHSGKKLISALIIGSIAGILICEAIVRILWSRQVIRMDNLGVISYEFMRETGDPDLPFELKPNLDMKRHLQGMRFGDVAMDDCHLSLNGHEVVARVLGNYIEDEILAKPR